MEWMKEQIQTYVKHCQRCQQSKVSNQKTSGLLIPLPTPSGPWQDVTMDFTEMPESLGYNYILVVVDWFSKEVVFVPCTKEETTYSTTELFRDHVWCQHGLPNTVVSDCGSAFASNFLGELYKLLGIKRKMSTAFHPQPDGQMEQLNHKSISTLELTSMTDRLTGLNGSKLPNLSGITWSLRSLPIPHLESPRVIPLEWGWSPQKQ